MVCTSPRSEKEPKSNSEVCYWLSVDFSYSHITQQHKRQHLKLLLTKSFAFDFAHSLKNTQVTTEYLNRCFVLQAKTKQCKLK